MVVSPLPTPPDVPPTRQLAFFESVGTPYVDFLLPDYNYDTYPADRYPRGSFGRWMIELFDLWISSGSAMEIRTFSVLMRLILGSRYSYDSFGALSRGVVVVETDGTFHALDVLKTAYDGATVTGCSLADTPVREL